MAQDGEDLNFISGCIVSILKAPTWVTPISNFIDENCIIFDDQEENKLEYTLVHNAFCKLVDDLLAAHLAELSVTVDQFTEFCRQGLTGENEVQRSLIEQLISVDDFLVFKAMMVKRSADLAHETIVQPLQPEADPNEDDIPEALKLEALRLEAERLAAERRCLEAELQLITALALQLEQRMQLTQALSELEEAVARMEVLSLAAANDDAAQATTTMAAPLSAPAELPPLQVRTSGVPGALPPTIRIAPLLQDVAGMEAVAAPPTATDPAPSRPAVGPCTKPSAIQQPSAEERQLRAEHLKRQRELLVARKRQEREGQLSEYGQTHGNTAGVRAAEKACQETVTMGAQDPDRGKRLAAELAGNTAPPQSTLPDPEEAAIQMRKTIVRQLKQSLTGGVSAVS
mmetsp:Transcript_83067/g.164771  ORF Transcript_83067/g.164771 Transcript_83067/m.164771 type:complete len:401 (+) Transcript_83067:47-1249(+)